MRSADLWRSTLPVDSDSEEDPLPEDDSVAGGDSQHEFEYTAEIGGVSSLIALGGGLWYRYRRHGERPADMNVGDHILLADNGTQPLGAPVVMWKEFMLAHPLKFPSKWLCYTRKMGLSGYMWTAVELVIGQFRLVGSRAAGRAAPH